MLCTRGFESHRCRCFIRANKKQSLPARITPCRTWTCDHRLRRPTFYPTELRGHMQSVKSPTLYKGFFFVKKKSNCKKKNFFETSEVQSLTHSATEGTCSRGSNCCKKNEPSSRKFFWGCPYGQRMVGRLKRSRFPEFQPIWGHFWWVMAQTIWGRFWVNFRGLVSLSWEVKHSADYFMHKPTAGFEPATIGSEGRHSIQLN